MDTDVLAPIEDSGGDAKDVVDVVTQLRQVDEDIKAMICSSVNKMDQEKNLCDERIKSLDSLVDAKEDELLFLSSKLSEMEDDLDTKKGKIELLATKYTNIENELFVYKEKLQLAENKNEEIIEKIEKMGCEEFEKNTEKLLVVEKENEDNKKIIVLLQEQLNENKQNVRTNNDTSFIEHRLAEKIYTLQNDNKQLKDSVWTLSQDILDKNKVTNENDKESLFKSLKATEALLQLQRTNCQKTEILASDLTLKLELEHDRRVRAQSVIDDLEKEKVIREGEMQKKVTECNQKNEQIAELTLLGDFKEEKMTKTLESVIEEKDAQILKTQERANELAIKSEEFEEYFMNQTEVAITLQSELQTSYEENKSLKKEMEMLNEMFEQMEHSIKVKEALDGEGYNGNEIMIYQDGKKVNVKVNELLELAASENQDNLQETCFNQVTTKNGTRMVVSVGKTFVKLRGLILEKKTLEEQLDQMKNINEHLCTHVNNHEQKLCNITEELNNTWFYVDKIKEQTKMLHNSETILRAELAEKRELLSKLRRDLEESRASWNQVKLKNEDSERQWKSLKEDFAERRRMIWTPPASSESGFSEADTEGLRNQSDVDNGDPPVTIPIDIENIDPLSLPVGTPEVVIASGIGAEFDDDDDESIPDPFSDEEDDMDDMIYVDVYANNMISSTTTITNDMPNDLDDEEDEEDYSEENIPLFIPSASYMSQIPSQLQIPLFPSRKEQSQYQEVAEREGIDFTALNHCDDNVKDLINRMMCTSARSAFLATSLADLQRRITSGHHFCVSDDDVDTDEEPRITEDDTGEDTESIEIESELGDLDTPPGMQDNIPPAPPLPSFSLLPPTSHLTVRPTYETGSSDDDDDDDDGRRRRGASPESSTAVTRFLIKHLPKQLSQLRNEKAILEEKVKDLEALNMEQRTRMGEHERRADSEKTKASKLEDILSKQKEVPALGDQEVPVCVEEAGVLLTWTITSNTGEEPSFIVFFSSKDGSEKTEVPPLSTEVIPPQDEIDMIQTVLLTSCKDAGIYTLHVRGTTHGAPNVTLGFQMEKKPPGS